MLSDHPVSLLFILVTDLSLCFQFFFTLATVLLLLHSDSFIIGADRL